MITEKDITDEEFKQKEKNSKKIPDSELQGAAQYAILEASHWDDAVNLLLKHKKHFESQICVLSLFALELYMKSILMSKGINVTTQDMSHNLYDMYNKLSKKEKEQIQSDVHIDKKII